METSHKLITKLKELKEENSITSYPHIKNILKNQLIPVAFSEFHPTKLIRCRRHNNNELFFSSSEDLSYRKDILNIKSFGRANEPGQGFFYCNDNKNQNTGIAEAVSVFRDNEESQEEILTMGVWNLKKSLKLAVILPSDENIGINKEFDDIKHSFNNFEKSEDFNDLKNFNEFLAKEFTLDLKIHKSNYKITCAFSNYIKEQFPEIEGIMYGSIKAEFQGTNIVLWPEVVDEKTEFLAARKSVYKREIGNKIFVEVQTYDSKTYDKETDKIVW